MSSNIAMDSGYLTPVPRTPGAAAAADLVYDTIDEDYDSRPTAPDHFAQTPNRHGTPESTATTTTTTAAAAASDRNVLQTPTRLQTPESAAGRSHVSVKIPTLHGVTTLLALALLLSVVAMATAVGLFVKLDKEMQQRVKELGGENSALQLELGRLRNLASPAREFWEFFSLLVFL